MFNDIINSSSSSWTKLGPLDWYYTGYPDIRLRKRTSMIYDLSYDTILNKEKTVIGRTDDEAKDKAEDFLKNNGII